MRHPFLLGSVLALALVACQQMTTGNASGQASGAWEDIPVPQGFRAVQDAALAVPITAGEYRAGELRYRGRSTAEKVQEYYQDRMPRFGWDWDQADEVWVKENTEVQVVINDSQQKGYEDLPGRLEILLRVRTQRPTLEG